MGNISTIIFWLGTRWTSAISFNEKENMNFISPVWRQCGEKNQHWAVEVNLNFHLYNDIWKALTLRISRKIASNANKIIILWSVLMMIQRHWIKLKLIKSAQLSPQNETDSSIILIYYYYYTVSSQFQFPTFPFWRFVTIRLICDCSWFSKSNIEMAIINTVHVNYMVRGDSINERN